MNQEIHLHNRIDELGRSAESYLEEIPTEYSFEEMAASDFLPIYHLYEECIDLIHILRAELKYGKGLLQYDEFTGDELKNA